MGNMVGYKVSSFFAVWCGFAYSLEINQPQPAIFALDRFADPSPQSGGWLHFSTASKADIGASLVDRPNRQQFLTPSD